MSDTGNIVSVPDFIPHLPALATAGAVFTDPEEGDTCQIGGYWYEYGEEMVIESGMRVDRSGWWLL